MDFAQKAYNENVTGIQKAFDEKITIFFKSIITDTDNKIKTVQESFEKKTDIQNKIGEFKINVTSQIKTFINEYKKKRR